MGKKKGESKLSRKMTALGNEFELSCYEVADDIDEIAALVYSMEADMRNDEIQENQKRERLLQQAREARHQKKFDGIITSIFTPYETL